MRKTKEQKNNLSRSMVLSIIFHVLLFSFIILDSLDEIIKLGSSDQGDEVVNMIMLDPSVVVEHYNQLKWQKNSPKQVDAERKKHIQQQEEELRKQQEKEQKRFKIVEKEHIKIVREAEQQRKQQAEEGTIKAKVEQEQLIKERAGAKAKVEAQARKEAKEKAEKATETTKDKKKANATKQVAIVNSLLGGLTARQPIQQTGGVIATGQGGNRKNGAFSSDVIDYAGKIKAAVESKFHNADIYHGKICELNIKLAPDGKLIGIAAKSNTANDQPLCDAAMYAIKTAAMPKPPSPSIYDAFNEQGGTLVFKP